LPLPSPGPSWAQRRTPSAFPSWQHGYFSHQVSNDCIRTLSYSISLQVGPCPIYRIQKVSHFRIFRFTSLCIWYTTINQCRFWLSAAKSLSPSSPQHTKPQSTVNMKYFIFLTGPNRFLKDVSSSPPPVRTWSLSQIRIVQQGGQV
jgi:hypothetical protein